MGRGDDAGAAAFFALLFQFFDEGEEGTAGLAFGEFLLEGAREVVRGVGGEHLFCGWVWVCVCVNKVRMGGMGGWMDV